MNEPLYARIARALAQKITAGELLPGGALPPEAELCRLYSASRHTVRSALRELTDLGLVNSRHGVGSFVAEAGVRRGGFDQSLDSIDDLVQLAESNQRVVMKVDEVVADHALAREIGCAPGTRRAHFASIRLDVDPAQPPICWTDNYVDPAYAGVEAMVRENPSALVSTLIEQSYGRRSVEVHQSITAVGVPAALAEVLKAPPDSPALKIVRNYLDRRGITFETTVTIHPLGRFQLQMVLRRKRD